MADPKMHELAKKFLATAKSKKAQPKAMARKSAPKPKPSAKPATVAKKSAPQVKSLKKKAATAPKVASPEEKLMKKAKEYAPKPKKPIGSMTVSEYNKKFTTDGIKKPKMAPRAMEIAKEIEAEAPFKVLDRDLPKAGRVMSLADEAVEADSATAAGKALKSAASKQAAKRLGVGAAVGGVLGLGAAALMEGLQAEEAGGEEEQLEEASLKQQEKTNAKLAKKQVKLPSTQEASTKPYYPKAKSDRRVKDDFKSVLKKNFPAETSEEESYRLRIKNETGGPLSNAERAKVIATHDKMRKLPGVKKPAHGVITLDEDEE